MMNWKRAANGRYVAGPFTVEKVLNSWYADGPSNAGPGIRLDSAHLRKDQAQGLCCQVASARAANPNVEAVAGDAVILPDGRKGFVRAVMRGPDFPPLYSIRFPRGKRLCLRRDEFTVVVP